MKKVFLSLIAIVLGAMSSFAQSDLVATLTHRFSLPTSEYLLAIQNDMGCTYLTKMSLNDDYLATIYGTASSICYLGINRPLGLVKMPIENVRMNYTNINDQ